MIGRAGGASVTVRAPAASTVTCWTFTSPNAGIHLATGSCRSNTPSS